jgi:Ran-binding protein 1
MAADSCVVTPEMVLKENIGSDRSWVYSTTADISDGVPTAETLAIRFGNSDSTLPLPSKPCLSLLTDFVDANLFKQHFEQAQQENAKAFVKS